MSAHTPGPWEVLTVYDHKLKADVAVVRIGCQFHIIGHGEESKANACLISAAPELLVFVKDWLEREGSEESYMAGKARAAIAKAIG